MNILVWLGNKNLHPAIYPNMKSIADALADMGHKVITCNTANGEEVMAAISLLRDEKIIDLSIGCNAMGMKVIVDDGKPLNIYEDLDVLHISILLDEPFNPACHGPQHVAKRHMLTYLDRSDRMYFSGMRMAENKYKLFMPLGGTKSEFSLDELFARKKQAGYGVVVSAGKFACNLEWPRWSEYGATSAMSKVLDDMLSLLKSEPLSLVMAAKQVLTDRGMEENSYFRPIASFFPLILCYIKAWRRRHMLKELLAVGVDIDLFGEGWESGDFAHGVNIHGLIPYDRMLEVIAQAKVVVNDEACFNNGAHDRVFTSMLHGTVVVSEYSSYLAEEFTEGQNIFMFNWQETRRQLEVISRLLQDDRYREMVAANAYNQVIDKHTWHHRARRLLEAAELVSFQWKLQRQEM